MGLSLIDIQERRFALFKSGLQDEYEKKNQGFLKTQCFGSKISAQ